MKRRKNDIINQHQRSKKLNLDCLTIQTRPDTRRRGSDEKKVNQSRAVMQKLHLNAGKSCVQDRPMDQQTDRQIWRVIELIARNELLVTIEWER